MKKLISISLALLMLAFTFSSCANTYGKPPKISGAIDHVFFSKTGVNAVHYETIISEYTYCYSDHVPVSFDFTLT